MSQQASRDSSKSLFTAKEAPPLLAARNLARTLARDLAMELAFANAIFCSLAISSANSLAGEVARGGASLAVSKLLLLSLLAAADSFMQTLAREFARALATNGH